MEESISNNRPLIQPKTMAELLPDLSGILGKDSKHILTARKKPRATGTLTSTTEKTVKPLTFAEMRADILALKVNSPKYIQPTTSTMKKRNWNSSVKVDKKISHTANGQLKHNPVRKVLNFQPKQQSSRMTMVNNSETPKFPKPEVRAKKSIHIQAKTNIRISGVCNIPETPVEGPKPRIINKRVTIANKENVSVIKENPVRPMNIIKKLPPPPLLNPKTSEKKVKANVKRLGPNNMLDTPLSNDSWKSSCDASFLQKEKEIHDIEQKIKSAEDQTLENIAEVSPLVSTPFKEYRNVNEYFNNSSDIETSVLYNDNTIMCFDKPSVSKDTDNREESVIVSLCDLLNKATVTNTDNNTKELEDLFIVQKQTEQNIKMIEDGIQTLIKIKESEIKSLININKVINEKKSLNTIPETKNKLMVQENKTTPKIEKETMQNIDKSPTTGNTCSVIKSCLKSPSYKIPKKATCLRKKVFYKSMPNMSGSPGVHTPSKDNKALNMYMKMKEQMNFLHTPVPHHRVTVTDTPARTKHNLQQQLDKLYNGS